MKTKIHEGGRLVIPAAYRKALGLKPGDEVQLLLEDDEIRLLSTRRAITRAQAFTRKLVPKGRSMVEDLLRERREEAARE